MQCRNCHSLGGEGGQRGPALDAVATRLTEDQLIRQVLQGRGNMPAYGKHLQPAEVTALVAFMQTLRLPNEPLARVIASFTATFEKDFERARKLLMPNATTVPRVMAASFRRNSAREQKWRRSS
jgi:hypothetical protein